MKWTNLTMGETYAVDPPVDFPLPLILRFEGEPMRTKTHFIDHAGHYKYGNPCYAGTDYREATEEEKTLLLSFIDRLRKPEPVNSYQIF